MIKIQGPVCKISDMSMNSGKLLCRNNQWLNETKKKVNVLAEPNKMFVFLSECHEQLSKKKYIEVEWNDWKNFDRKSETRKNVHAYRDRDFILQK